MIEFAVTTMAKTPSHLDFFQMGKNLHFGESTSPVASTEPMQALRTGPGKNQNLGGWWPFSLFAIVSSQE